MSALVISRRAVLGVVASGAGVAVAGGIIPHRLAAASRLAADEHPAAAMLAAAVLVRPDHGAELRLALIDAGGRLVKATPPMQLSADILTEGGQRVSAWRQAQQAASCAQTFATAAVAQLWSVPAEDCVVGIGRIVHRPTKRAIRHAVWVDVA